MNHVYIDASDTFGEVVAALDTAGYHNVAQALQDDAPDAGMDDVWALIATRIVPLMESCGLETHVIDDEMDTGYVVVTHRE